MSSFMENPKRTFMHAEADKRLAKTNDLKWFKNGSVAKVDKARWNKAQEYEKVSTKNGMKRVNDTHKKRLGNYECLPEDLGVVIEFGCGLYTQAETILELRTAKKLHLLDPLMDRYLKSGICRFRNGELNGFKNIVTECAAIEDFTGTGFDTAILINVIEHVMDADKVFDIVFNSLKPGGIIIFGERGWKDYNPKITYDVGHPIRLTAAYLRKFCSRFQPLYEFPAPTNKKAWTPVYFIGRKAVK